MVQLATNYYDDLFSRLIGDGVPLPTVVERVAGAYLDGKPLPIGKKKLTKKERDSLFWASQVVRCCPPDAWVGEPIDRDRSRKVDIVEAPTVLDRCRLMVKAALGDPSQNDGKDDGKTQALRGEHQVRQ